MKFNLLLLLLTTITAVALSQITKIQLSPIGGHNDLFWAVNGTVVVLKQGADWIITEDGRILLRGIPGKSVQYNGNGKLLTIADTDTGSLAQRWEFSHAPGRSEYICSKKDPNMCATAVSGIIGWLVVALPKRLSSVRYESLQWWIR